MKVALCLSGMPRSFKSCAESLRENFIDIYHPDIFISTWKSDIVDDAFPETDSAEELIELYKPIKFDIEIFDKKREATFETNQFKNFADRQGRSVSRMLPMFYKIYLADFHRFMYEQENKFTYDVVVRCRTDLQFHAPVNIEKPLKNVIYFPTKNTQNHVGDQLWYCDSETSTVLSALYMFIPQMWHAGVIIHGETLVYAYMAMKDLTIHPVDIAYDLFR